MQLAVNVTFVGVTVVFLVLVLLTFIISLFGKIFGTNKQSNAVSRNEDLDDYRLVEEENEAGAEAEAEASVEEQSGNEQLIAVLTAAVAASLYNNVSSSFRVKSFRRISQPDSLWNQAARNEQIISKKIL